MPCSNCYSPLRACALLREAPVTCASARRKDKTANVNAAIFVGIYGLKLQLKIGLAILGASAKLRKASNTLVMSVCLSSCNNSAPIGWIFMIFNISGYFENVSREFNFN
jgi:hypothetical protein